MSVSILFVTDKGFLPSCIRLFTNSNVDHVALRIGDLVFEIMPNEDGGCIYYHSLIDFNAKRVFIDVEIPNVDETLMLNFQYKWYNKNYDWLFTCMWPFRSLFSTKVDSKKWNCIEHIYFSFLDQDIELWGGENLSPGELEKIINYNKGE